jgi:AcrR family transcriptional regulator
MARTGRRPGVSKARERILLAARARFAGAGLDGASIREIASEAGVDPALVYHYFGTKQRLFVAATAVPFDPERLQVAVIAGPPQEAGARLARTVLAIWDDPVSRAPLEGLLRSAITDPGAAAMVRELIVERLVGPLIAALGSSDPALRATLVGSQVIGLAIARYILAVEPLASLASDELSTAVAPTFKRYLLGSLGTSGDA